MRFWKKFVMERISIKPANIFVTKRFRVTEVQFTNSNRDRQRSGWSRLSGTLSSRVSYV
jgi:hypothetical protein